MNANVRRFKNVNNLSLQPLSFFIRFTYGQQKINFRFDTFGAGGGSFGVQQVESKR
jgi:hypothetical protein